MNEETLASIHNYRPIDDVIATSGQPTVEQLADIAAAGYSAVINLALHDDPRYSLPDEPGVVESLGLQYVHIPVGFTGPTENHLLKFFAAMAAHSNKKVWVHCAANKRVSAFLGLYWVIQQRWPRERAFALMHGLWQPDEIWNAFISNMLKKYPAGA